MPSTRRFPGILSLKKERYVSIHEIHSLPLASAPVSACFHIYGDTHVHAGEASRQSQVAYLRNILQFLFYCFEMWSLTDLELTT